MTENMLTIDRLFDFGVLGFHDTCRLSVIGVVRALSGAISDRLSDIGVLEELTRFHIQQNIRLYGAYTFFNCCRLPIWHKKQEDRSSRPSCWVIYAIARYAVARGSLKFVACCSCAVQHCTVQQRIAGISDYRDSRKRCCAARPSSSHLNTPASSRTCEKTIPTSS